MVAKLSSPYGSWKSPISSELIVSGTIKLGQIMLDGLDIYWEELRPSENGRNALVKWSVDDGIEEISPAGFNVRTRVHEYGGGAFTVHQGDVYFINFVDQRLYRQIPYAEAEQITTGNKMLFANLIFDQFRNRIICVREDHSTSGAEAVNSLVALNLEGDETEGQLLVSGNDFYASPCLSPDGRQLAWLTWNHPNMPWDGTELWVGDFDEAGKISDKKLIAGGINESIFQPQWSPDGILHFVSDRTNWWNLYRWHKDQIEPMCQMDAEFGLPQWVFGMSTYGFESSDSIICTYSQNGRWNLARLNTTTSKLKTIETPFTSISNLKVAAGFAVFVGGSPTESSVLVRLNLETYQFERLRKSDFLTVESGYLSQPQAIEYPTENGLTAHAFYYPPQNQDYVKPEGELPPLLVISHGGPTSATSTTLELKVQYWTSRGFGMLDVNYGGSTGYGREYRQRLNSQWGIVDVRDCINAARYLAEQNIVDGKRLAIRGSSAGGFTTLCALTFHDTFSAGASYYGISDIEALAKDTHKFESRYLDSMIGPYPEKREIYIARSPIHFVDQIKCPLILFQGLEDRVVPPNQAEMLFDAVKAKGIPVAYVPFEGEQHGFRIAKNIKQALEGEYYFYCKIFGIELSMPIKPVPIENLDS